MKLDSLGNWRRTHFSTDITPELAGSEVTVMGWVENVRDLGGLKFFVLHDIRGTIQITAPKAKVRQDVLNKIDTLTAESVVAVRGKVVAIEQAPRGVEILPQEIKLLNLAATPLPLDPTGRIKADLDTRLDARMLDLRRPRQQAIFRIRHKVLQIVREFLISKNFMEVNTPKIVATATESGAALFPVSYFDREAFLSQSPQLYKEVLTACFDRVFEIGPIFRAEEHDTTRHLNEVTSIDIEAAFVTQDDVMDILEELIVQVFRRVKEGCAEELATLKRELEEPKTPFPRITYDEALRMLDDVGIKIPWGEDLPTPAERKLGELIPTAYFITDWPTAVKPFYIMPREDNPELSYAFDLMYKDLELASGGTRIHQEDLLVEQLKRKGLNPEHFESHLKNFRFGMVPHAGWGLGLDRLVMVLAGLENIREAVLFPRDRRRLTP
jgi:aspartyl-tRNA synthetase